MIWLGIETSCDDTSIALVKDGKDILANLISSQIDIHKIYGGVVPEIASRKHLETINPLIQEALNIANIGFEDIDAIAVSNGPGLIGSLLVGVAAAKTLATTLNIPILAVNHLPAHIYANFLEDPIPELPALALLISGGHTCLAVMEEHGKFKFLGETRDDAVGECYDKSARVMGLPYPGGPEIDRLAKEGDGKAIKFPRPYMSESKYEFSFSGLKTAVLQYCRKNPDFNLPDTCASLQEAISDVVVRKTLNAMKDFNLKRLMIAGGVACNSGIRQKFESECKKRNFEFFRPRPILCTDNAAMVACCAYHEYNCGKRSDLLLDVYPSASWEDYIKK